MREVCRRECPKGYSGRSRRLKLNSEGFPRLFRPVSNVARLAPSPIRIVTEAREQTMDWITQAAKERDDRRLRREAIERDAASLWEKIRGTMEQAVKDYEETAEKPRQAKISGRTAQALHVAVFEKKREGSGMQLARVAIVFDRKQNTVEIRTAIGSAPRKFHIGLDHEWHACLMHEGHETPPEEFAKAALYEVFFPEEAHSMDLED
jgi:hypothetical protein